MTWFKIDDKSTFHPKVLRAGNQGWGALVRAGAWSSSHGKDGFVPDDVAELIEHVSETWSRLSEAGLIHKVKGGWMIHDFLDYNPTAREVSKKRAERSKAGRIGGKRSAESRANVKQTVKQTLKQNSTIAQAPKQNHVEAKPNPVPSRPDPSASSKQSVQSGHPHHPTSEQLLEELNRHEALSVLNRESFSKALLGNIMTAKPKSIDAIARAIADAATEVAAAGLNAETAARKVRVFVQNARETNPSIPDEADVASSEAERLAVAANARDRLRKVTS